MKESAKLILDHDKHIASNDMTFKYYPECPFCGAISDQSDYIQWCVSCKHDLVQNTGTINWLEITKRLLSQLERADIDSMTLIGVINWIARQPEIKDHPLPLPSDDAIRIMADNLAYGCDSPYENFITGAKWMRSKLSGL